MFAALFGRPFGGLLGLFWVVLVIYVLYTLWTRSRLTEGTKIIWTIIILIFPVLGLILYALFGRPNR